MSYGMGSMHSADSADSGMLTYFETCLVPILALCTGRSGGLAHSSGPWVGLGGRMYINKHSHLP